MSMLDARADLRMQAEAMFQRKKIMSFGIPAAIIVYLLYVFFSFDVPSLLERARLDNGLKLVEDTYSYKTHVVRDNRRGGYEFAIEGEKKGRYPEGETPEWVSATATGYNVDLEDGYAVRFVEDVVEFDIPGYGTIFAKPTRQQVELTLPVDEIPDWISASKNRVTINTPNGRLAVSKAKTELHRFFFGWELFFFTLDSPYYDHSLGDILFGDRIDPARSNISGALDDFWNNPMWRHGDVAWALFETVLMAFLGTMGGAIIALPMAFIAARNFMPVLPARFGIRRVFDVLRGVDHLIWTIILARAFGPGPLTGSIAILLTDTGTFGKLFSEALENVDNKQIEGVQSTGADRLQRYRFGVIPQITPVFLSQILYYLESNTRSATVIGAIVGGGIGLMLTQAMITHKDWEEVTYYILLVILMVMLMDSFSGWLRRRLITGKQDKAK